MILFTGGLHQEKHLPLLQGLRLRAEVQVAQAAGLRPQQRLRRHLHGLVPLPRLLLLQVRVLSDYHYGRPCNVYTTLL